MALLVPEVWQQKPQRSTGLKSAAEKAGCKGLGLSKGLGFDQEEKLRNSPEGAAGWRKSQSGDHRTGYCLPALAQGQSGHGPDDWGRGTWGGRRSWESSLPRSLGSGPQPGNQVPYSGQPSDLGGQVATAFWSTET